MIFIGAGPGTVVCTRMYVQEISDDVGVSVGSALAAQTVQFVSRQPLTALTYCTKYLRTSITLYSAVLFILLPTKSILYLYSKKNRN